MYFKQLNLNVLLIVAIVIIIVGIWCSTQLRQKFEEEFANVEFPTRSGLEYKKLNETCSSEDFKEDEPITTLTAEDAEIGNCLTQCDGDHQCQSVIFNNGNSPTCELYNEKCYNIGSKNDYNPNRDCENSTSCSYNKDNVISNQFQKMTGTDSRFIRTRRFCPMDDEDLGNLIPQGDNEEDETEVPTVADCINKCANDSNCNSVHVKNFGDVSKKNMKCRLYTGKCLKPADFYNSNCNEELCSYNKYPCGQYECRETKVSGLSKFKLFCNNFLFDNTTYNTEDACQAKINNEMAKPIEEQKICPANCNNEAKLYNDVMLDIDPHSTLLKKYSLGID